MKYAARKCKLKVKYASHEYKLIIDKIVFFKFGYLSWRVLRNTYDMFSKYKYLIVNLVFPTSDFGVRISL